MPPQTQHHAGPQLTVEDPVLLLLADHLATLARALAQRGHAAQDRLRVRGAAAGGGGLDDGLRACVRELAPARGHPEWERGTSAGASDADRQELESALARRLEERFTRDG